MIQYVYFQHPRSVTDSVFIYKSMTFYIITLQKQTPFKLDRPKNNLAGLITKDRLL